MLSKTVPKVTTLTKLGEKQLLIGWSIKSHTTIYNQKLVWYQYICQLKKDCNWLRHITYQNLSNARHARF